MGMKLTIEIELDFPDLSTHKHVEFLKHVFKNQMVKTVDLIDNRNGKKIPVIGKYELDEDDMD